MHLLTVSNRTQVSFRTFYTTLRFYHRSVESWVSYFKIAAWTMHMCINSKVSYVVR